MNEVLVSINQISKRFNEHQPLALKNIQGEIKKGEIVGLVGPDGSGKSTLIRLLAGLLKPTRGSIQIAGYDSIENQEEIAHLIGYMPQRFGLYEDLSVQQNLNLYAELRGVAEDKKEETFKSLLHFTGLTSFTNRLAGALSGGMKQKLGLACALVKKPTLLLLDEPSIGVDPISRRELWKLVQNLLKQEMTVVWSTAYLDEAERCQTVFLLNEGELLFHGNPEALTKKMKGKTFENAFITLLGGEPAKDQKLVDSIPSVASSHTIMIEARHLTKKFGSFTAADNISLDIQKGEIFGLLGPNGAGKTTTFKMLCGLLKPTSGTSFVNGVNLQTSSAKAREQIGYMAQKFSLYGSLSVKQNLFFFSGIYNLTGTHRTQMINLMIDIFGLSSYLNETTDLLPLGYKQRLALACALMHHPSTLFLDEPTSGVDPVTRREFWNHINALVKKGVTVMVTTHFIEEAEYCDRIGLVYQSQLIKTGTPDELKNSVKTKKNPFPSLEDAFIKHIEDFDKKIIL